MSKLRVLVACEYSGVVREAFRRLGHDAWSVDLLESEDLSPYHVIGDYTVMLDKHWDILIGHPPCTHLASSGAKYFKEKRDDGRQAEAVSFFVRMMGCGIEKICLENPIGVLNTMYRKYDQIINPWQFGHGVRKETCLWLRNLPKLVPTNIVEGRSERLHRLGPSKTRWKERSRTFQGIAEAMAQQWGGQA
jgi:hypothetical protein